MEIIRENFDIKIACHTAEFPALPLDFHWHENYEICQVLNHRCSFLIDGVPVDAEAGDIIAVNGYTVHRFIVHEEHTLFRIVQFPSKLLMNAPYPVQPLKIHIPRTEIEKVPGLQPALDDLFALMEAEGYLYNPDKNPFLESLVCPLYFLLMRHFADDAAGGNTKERMEFYRITEYIRANLGGDLTAQAIAGALFLPRRRLASVFSQYAGISLNEYVNTLRIRRANALLDEGSSVTNAALESGFQSIRTFNNVYKRLTGQTPTSRTSFKSDL